MFTMLSIGNMYLNKFVLDVAEGVLVIHLILHVCTIMQG
jgi:hypothetical protein